MRYPMFPVALVGAALIGTVSYAAEPAPVFVQHISDALVARLKAERANYKRNPAVLTSIIQQNIEPYIDLPGFANGVMGTYARQATPAQHNTFINNFRQVIIKSYAEGLKKFDNETYTLRPFVPGHDPSKAIVGMNFKMDDGSVVPITYQLVQIGNNWKVRNVQINGIDLGLTFRNQFATTVQANHGNLDQAIKSFVPSANVAPK